jgi:hypothetical protein
MKTTNSTTAQPADTPSPQPSQVPGTVEQAFLYAATGAAILASAASEKAKGKI